jgi:hypothetical protein
MGRSLYRVTMEDVKGVEGEVEVMAKSEMHAIELVIEQGLRPREAKRVADIEREARQFELMEREAAHARETALAAERTRVGRRESSEPRGGSSLQSSESAVPGLSAGAFTDIEKGKRRSIQLEQDGATGIGVSNAREEHDGSWPGLCRIVGGVIGGIAGVALMIGGAATAAQGEFVRPSAILLAIPMSIAVGLLFGSAVGIATAPSSFLMSRRGERYRRIVGSDDLLTIRLVAWGLILLPFLLVALVVGSIVRQS